MNEIIAQDDGLAIADGWSENEKQIWESAYTDFSRFMDEVLKRFSDSGWEFKQTDWYGINATQYEIKKPTGEVVRIWTPVWGEWDGKSKEAMALIVCALGQAEEQLITKAPTQENSK